VTATDSAFSLATLEFDAVRDQLARHASFSAGRQLALQLEPTGELREAQLSLTVKTGCARSRGGRVGDRDRRGRR